MQRHAAPMYRIEGSRHAHGQRSCPVELATGDMMLTVVGCVG
eukprot:CAMPEP_0171166640 /NCGR_PEP_ID=MMETSP0790-20130122/6797_1 /TAXON_ID=2925 /ORGANISM="Alexandrium catenella, Strain OF101" /LENGTH=41 /DNA_ID= /DNA_START= /DNA_END= /DNA_ORIENTATION=